MSRRGEASAIAQTSSYAPEELMAIVIARDIRNGETVATGADSAIPAAGCLLAQRLHAPRTDVIILGSRKYFPFHEGSKEFFDFAQRGRLDLFFLSGAQIDQAANINLSYIGGIEHPSVRMPGAHGSGIMYFVARRTILFRTEHTARTFVPHVDFVTSPGGAPPPIARRGLPHFVVTPIAVLTYDAALGRLRLGSIHPGTTLQEVQARTGFDLGVEGEPAVTPPPSPEELRVLRTEVREELLSIYPEFAREVLRDPAAAPAAIGAGT